MLNLAIGFVVGVLAGYFCPDLSQKWGKKAEQIKEDLTSRM